MLTLNIGLLGAASEDPAAKVTNRKVEGEVDCFEKLCEEKIPAKDAKDEDKGTTCL